MHKASQAAVVQQDAEGWQYLLALALGAEQLPADTLGGILWALASCPVETPGMLEAAFLDVLQPLLDSSAQRALRTTQLLGIVCAHASAGRSCRSQLLSALSKRATEYCRYDPNELRPVRVAAVCLL